MTEISNNSDKKEQNLSRFESLLNNKKLNDLKQKLTTKDIQNTSSAETETIIIVSVDEQKLYHFKNKTLIKSYLISTAEAGVGNLSGSYQTPLGIHRIAEKFGEIAPIASIFKARKNTNTIAEILYEPDIRSGEDNITSRILWLDGLEVGLNKGTDKTTPNNVSPQNIDSYNRYIYIHGTDEEGLLGKPASHGCVRMANVDVIEIFDKLEVNDLVVIIKD